MWRGVCWASGALHLHLQNIPAGAGLACNFMQRCGCDLMPPRAQRAGSCVHVVKSKRARQHHRAWLIAMMCQVPGASRGLVAWSRITLIFSGCRNFKTAVYRARPTQKSSSSTIRLIDLIRGLIKSINHVKSQAVFEGPQYGMP